MSHRGPDAAGFWRSGDGEVALAHRRLAIIDLSPAGQQPMCDERGELHIVLNGEIYNYIELRKELRGRGHRFRSESDTEVLLAAFREWGHDCLQRLNGMFAFAIYDSRDRRVLLARDRAGEKPLFYARAGRRLVFASELKALMALPGFERQLDVDALQFFFTYGYVPGARCILRHVSKLPAAHALAFGVDEGATRVWQYWTLPPPAPAPQVADGDLLAEIERLLEDSVRRQLVADVPVGVLLSGGIDSGLVTAMAARVSPSRVRTFTISFPGYGRFDEGPVAKSLAAHFGTEHTELVAEPDLVECLPMLARQYDEPMADSSLLPTFLVSRLIRRHATVALAGDGGDELFGGYPHYTMLLRQQPIRRLVPRMIRQAFGAAAARGLPIGLKGRNHIIGFTAELSRSIAHVNVFFDAWARRRLLRPVLNGRSSDEPERSKAALSLEEHSVLRRATETDFRSTMVDAYLVKVDRASMLNALEVRAPWLDYRLVEFAFGRVPDRLRATATERKILPRRLAARLFPPAVDLHRKQGFSLPLAAWFEGEWGRYTESVVRQADPALFDQALVARLLDGQRRGYSNAQRLFALTMFELWRREYRIHL
jgi:asparagine synthase (glutamine-hydrolysing)